MTYKILIFTLICFASNVFGQESKPIETDKLKNRNVVVTKNGAPVRTKDGGFVVHGR